MGRILFTAAGTGVARRCGGYVLSCAMMFLCAAASAGGFDYGDMRAGRFSQRTVRGLRSTSDGEHYTAVSEGAVVKYDYRTGTPVDTLLSLPGGRLADYILSPDERYIIPVVDPEYIYRHSYSARVGVYDIRSGRYVWQSRERVRVPSFSPDGRLVAYVRGNDLVVVEPNGGGSVDVTGDGEHNRIINGHTDWVCEEEFGFTRAYEFSPDGEKIAYMRFDESHVREYTLTRYDRGGTDDFPFPLYSEAYKYKYPKAGERNSVVELYVYDIGSGGRVRVDTGPVTDQYIPRMGWTPDGRFWYCRVNRLQNRFEVMLADRGVEDGVMQVRAIYEETDARYVERVDGQTVTFLPDGRRFVVRNETGGNTHLYLYDTERGLLNAVTSGKWDVTSLAGIEGETAYYHSCERSPLCRDLYSVRLDGSGKKRLTRDRGTNDVLASEGFRYFVNYFSNTETPLRVTLHTSDGRLVRTLEDNAALRERTAGVPKKEFFTFTTERGDELNGYMIKPAGFDASGRYPVMVTQYGGPGSQQVLDRWSMDWTDVLVQRGYVVACMDPRGTGGRGGEFKKCTYGRLGALETEDQISFGRYLKSLPWVDGSRLGIYGWSYGGFMALNCILRGADVFGMAIAVAPVTSWRFYDTIYTEIYNGLPQDNPSGYDDNSPVMYADRLEGKLLIVHGTGDDNVHVQNSYAMIRALVAAERKFDVMIYPDDNHSMVPHGRHHIMDGMIEYTLDNL